MDEQLKGILTQHLQDLEKARAKTIEAAQIKNYNEVILPRHKELDANRDSATSAISAKLQDDIERIKQQAQRDIDVGTKMSNDRIEELRQETEKAKNAITEAQNQKIVTELGAAFDKQINQLKAELEIG
jgi:DNA anti-recombination protein RmuC